MMYFLSFGRRADVSDEVSTTERSCPRTSDSKPVVITPAQFVGPPQRADSLHARGYPVSLMPEKPSSPSSSAAPDRVEVSVPLRTEFFATLRIVAASVGADAGFSVDEIDDLRLAISEVVSSLADGPGSTDDRIEASFELAGTGLTVTITTDKREVEIELDDLASSILDSVVDSYVIDGTRVTLVKLASEAATVASDVAQASTEQ